MPRPPNGLGLINAVFPRPRNSNRAPQRGWPGSIARARSSLRFAKKAFRLAQTDDFEERLASVEADVPRRVDEDGGRE